MTEPDTSIGEPRSMTDVPLPKMEPGRMRVCADAVASIASLSFLLQWSTELVSHSSCNADTSLRDWNHTGILCQRHRQARAKCRSVEPRWRPELLPTARAIILLPESPATTAPYLSPPPSPFSISPLTTPTIHPKHSSSPHRSSDTLTPSFHPPSHPPSPPPSNPTNPPCSPT